MLPRLGEARWQADRDGIICVPPPISAAVSSHVATKHRTAETMAGLTFVFAAPASQLGTPHHASFKASYPALAPNIG